MERTVTGDLVAATRVKLKLSRDKFAALVGLTPGAVWRIENKGTFKNGEVEKLRAVVGAPSDAVVAVPEPPAESPAPATAAVTVPTPSVSPQDELSDPIPVTQLTSTLAPIVTDPPTTKLPSEPEVLGLTELSPYQLFLQDGIRRYSNSEIQTFKRCPLKWYMVYYLALSPITESPVGARAIGDRLHRALRWHYHPDPTQRRDVRDALEIIIKIDLAELKSRYAPDVIPLGVETEFAKDADLERVMMDGYIQWLAETGGDAEFTVIGAEEYIEADLPEPINGQIVKIVGRLDARVRRVSDGARLFIDHKSVGNLVGPTRLLALNEQMKMYILLERLNASGTGEYVDGAIFNMMRRCKRTANAKPPFYARVEVRHNPTSLANFQRQLIGVITRIEEVRQLLNDGHNFRAIVPPVIGQDCTWACDFLPLHSIMDDGSHWESMANAFYRKTDPSSYYVKKNVIDPV